MDSKEPVLVSNISNATKVAKGDDLIVLTKDGNVVKVGETNTVIYNAKDAVDITAKDGNYMILTNSGKLYVWGANSNGELGLENNSQITTPTLVEMEMNVISIGAGTNNTYFIADSGLVYSAGLNTYGALGNETNENSNTYTLVGKREFSVTPNNVLMSVNDTKEFEIESERYNVLKEDKRTINDFEWTSNDTDIVTVEEDAKIKAIAEGETTITVTQKDTGAEEEIIVVVMPLDAQRLDKIAVNEVGKSLRNDEIRSYHSNR